MVFIFNPFTLQQDDTQKVKIMVEVPKKLNFCFDHTFRGPRVSANLCLLLLGQVGYKAYGAHGAKSAQPTHKQNKIDGQTHPSAKHKICYNPQKLSKDGSLQQAFAPKTKV